MDMIFFEKKRRSTNNDNNNNTNKKERISFPWIPKIGPKIKKEIQKFGFRVAFQTDPDLELPWSVRIKMFMRASI